MPRVASPLSSRSASERILPALLALLASVAGVGAAPTQGQQAGSAWELIERKAQEIQEANRIQGWSYVVSGGVTLAISIPGFYLSEDLFAQAAYSVTQTLGVAAVGYGSYLVLIEDDIVRFRNILRRSPDLGAAQREQLSRAYLAENAGRARNARTIRAVTHGLTAALNLTNAITASQSELKTALYFVGGINVLAAASALLVPSEDEALSRKYATSWKAGPIAHSSGGLGAAVQLGF